MKRNIIKQGKGGYTIYLPKKWVDEKGLGSGEYVELTAEKNRLIISSEKGYFISREKVDLTKLNTLLRRLFVSKYLKGSDEIEIFVDSLEKSRIVQKRADKLVGMEIIEQTKNRLLLKEISPPDEKIFESFLRRVFLLILEMSQCGSDELKKKETDLEYISDIELNINSFTDYCIRFLNKKGYSDAKETPAVYSIIMSMEELADDYKDLFEYITKNRLVLDKHLITIYEKLNTLYRMIYNLFYTFSNEKAAEITELSGGIKSEIDKRLDTVKSAKDAVLLGYFRSMNENNFRMMNIMLVMN